MEIRTAIVSGAAGNLGKAVVQHFLNNHCKVIGLVHQKSENRNPSQNYQELELDLTNANAAEKCVEQLIEQYKRIDIAVLTAGGFTMGDIESTSTEDIYKQYRLNFETAYNIARPVLTQMKKQNTGKIFFIGSIAGKDTTNGKGVTAYSLSKSLLFQLANIINSETIGTAIWAEVIVPYIIDTPQNRAAMPNADFSTWETPEQLATLIGERTFDNNPHNH